MASNPLFIIPDFWLHFPNELCYGYHRFEGNGKRVCPIGCLSFSLPSQRIFPICFKHKVAIAEFLWKMQRKTWYRHSSFNPVLLYRGIQSEVVFSRPKTALNMVFSRKNLKRKKKKISK